MTVFDCDGDDDNGTADHTETATGSGIRVVLWALNAEKNK